MKRLIGTLFFSLSVLLVAQAQTADACLGTWYNAEKDGKILIYKQGDKFFGKLNWMKTPNDVNGKPRLDDKNESESLRNRPLMGLILLKDFTFSGENIWENGKIYDPKNGKTYSCKLTLKNKNTLDVRGFVGFSLIGRTTTWTRTE